ncbi:MAG: cobalamin-dependent protein [Myxococcota bacterium]
MGTKPDHDPQRESLTRTIQAEIIPRLMLAHRVRPDRIPAPARFHSSPDVSRPRAVRFEPKALVADLLKGDSTAAIASIERLREAGARAEEIFLDLLAPAARHLGALWETDEATFTAVTVGLTHLQQIVRQFSPAFEAEGESEGSGYRAILAPAPGDQHVFGLLLLEEFFRRAGWDVVGAADAAQCDLVELVRTESIALVGFSIADRRARPALKTLIGRIREASHNRSILILVGGSFVLADPSVVHEVGADGTADSPAGALRLACDHLDRHMRAR